MLSGESSCCLQIAELSGPYLIPANPAAGSVLCVVGLVFLSASQRSAQGIAGDHSCRGPVQAYGEMKHLVRIAGERNGNGERGIPSRSELKPAENRVIPIHQGTL